MIIAPGETSSGKSSLLNLFMEDTVLPTKLLSTTSAVCELFYGDKFEGKLVTKTHDGQEEIKPFRYEDRKDYIYKQADRHEAFKHTVKLWVPLQLLKVSVIQKEDL